MHPTLKIPEVGQVLLSATKLGTPTRKGPLVIAALLAAMAVPASTYGAIFTCDEGNQSISSPLVSSIPPVVIAGGTCELTITSSITANGSGTFNPALLGQEDARITIDGGVAIAQGSGIGGFFPRAGIRLIDSARFTFLSGEVRGAGSGIDLDRAGILAEDNSVVIMSGGSANASGAALDSERTGVFAQESATVSISGGTVDVTAGSLSFGTVSNHLVSRDDAKIYIFGNGFNFPLGPMAPLNGTVTGFLQDGGFIDWSFTRDAGAQIILADGCTFPPGDITSSGATDVLDLQCIILSILSILGATPPPTCLAFELSLADVNCDGAVNVTDATLAIWMALSLPLDVGLDPDQDGCPDACGD